MQLTIIKRSNSIFETIEVNGCGNGSDALIGTSDTLLQALKEYRERLLNIYSYKKITYEELIQVEYIDQLNEFAAIVI
jgi:hypothetical protein